MTRVFRNVWEIRSFLKSFFKWKEFIIYRAVCCHSAYKLGEYKAKENVMWAIFSESWQTNKSIILSKTEAGSANNPGIHAQKQCDVYLSTSWNVIFCRTGLLSRPFAGSTKLKKKYFTFVKNALFCPQVVSV